MKRTSLLAAAAVVLVANTFALAHAWRNRSGAVTTDITLTERELPLAYNSDNDDSGVAFNLRWTDPQGFIYAAYDPAPWLDQNHLQELGFDTSLAPSDHDAYDYYLRQRPRRGFVALEYDGLSWQKWIDDVEAQAKKQSLVAPYMTQANSREAATRLLVIDSSSDPVRLRARHPDRGSVIIVPAVIRIGAQPRDARGPARFVGSIQEIPSLIHVPRPFSDSFQRSRGGNNRATYRVHLRYGASLEPWIVGVEFP